MRLFFGHWVAESGKPLVNKNNRNADCVPLLADVLPNAVFIEVSREPVYVVQSLLLARPTIQGRVERGWGLDSEEVELGASRETVIDSVCDQVIRIRQRLEGAEAVVGDGRYMRVRYEDLCANPAAVVEAVGAFVSLELRPGTDLTAASPFPLRNEPRLPDSEIQHIRRRLGELP
jgi:hypothetical protein